MTDVEGTAMTDVEGTAMTDVEGTTMADVEGTAMADRAVSVVDTMPAVEFLTIRNLDTGEAFVIGQNDPDFDFNTFALGEDTGGDPKGTDITNHVTNTDDGTDTTGTGLNTRNNTGWWVRMRAWMYRNKEVGNLSSNTPSGNTRKPKTPFTKLSSFKFHKELGKGAFGRVLLAEAKIDGNLYALKIISKKDMRSSDKRQAKAERDILLSMSHTHSHPFTTGLKFAFQSAHNLYLGMDYFPGGNLKEMIRKQGHLCEDWVRIYSAELVLAISHLHSLNVIYRDIKPHNIMIDSEGHIILIDYGLSKQAVSDPKGAQSLVGTPDYSAPEVLKTGVYRIEQSNKEKERKKQNKPKEIPTNEASTPIPDIGYGKAADWWSLGVMMYEMLSGTPAFRGKDLRQTYQRVLFAELIFEPENRFSADAKEILRGLLVRDPSQRLGAGENPPTDIMSMPFFNGIDWASIFERRQAGPVVPPAFNLANVNKTGSKYSSGGGNPKLNLRDSIIGVNDKNALQDWSFFDEPSLAKAAEMPAPGLGPGPGAVPTPTTSPIKTNTITDTLPPTPPVPITTVDTGVTSGADTVAIEINKISVDHPMVTKMESEVESNPKLQVEAEANSVVVNKTSSHTECEKKQNEENQEKSVESIVTDPTWKVAEPQSHIDVVADHE